MSNQSDGWGGVRLTPNDITILIEALDAWVEKDAAGELAMEMLKRTLGPMPPEVAREQQDRESDRIRRREVATLLQATLIRMRRDLESQENNQCPTMPSSPAGK